MVRTLYRREAVPRLTLNPNEERAQDEHRRAALAYLIWPAALYEHYAVREPASSWFKVQVAQAARFGNRWALGGFAALAWPLVAALLIPNLTFTIVIYGLALVLDAVLLVVWFRRALRYSKQAAQGETFSLETLSLR